MDSRFIATPAISAPPIAGSDEPPADQTTLLQFRENITTSCIDRIESVLYAYLIDELVAALDFTRTDGSVCINMVFVRPEFRHRGIGSALARYAAAQHPGAHITCASRPWCIHTAPAPSNE